MHTAQNRLRTNLVRHVLRGSAGVDKLEVRLGVLHHGAGNQAADAAEAVDTGVHRHGQLGAGRRSLGGHGGPLESARRHEGGGRPDEGHGSSGVEYGGHFFTSSGDLFGRGISNENEVRRVGYWIAHAQHRQRAKEGTIVISGMVLPVIRTPAYTFVFVLFAVCFVF